MIINLTQHSATADQVAAGVVDLSGDALTDLRDALTFDSIPTREEIRNRSEYIAQLAVSHEAEAAMIGGAPYLMSALEKELKAAGITPLYAFSTRESVEQKQLDGGVRKVNIFRHIGFVEA